MELILHHITGRSICIFWGVNAIITRCLTEKPNRTTFFASGGINSSHAIVVSLSMNGKENRLANTSTLGYPFPLELESVTGRDNLVRKILYQRKQFILQLIPAIRTQDLLHTR